VLKKNRFFFLLFFNAILLIFILLLSIPISKFLKNTNLESNEYIKDQAIIKPEAKPHKVLDRTLNIKFVAKVNKTLKWEFEPLQENIDIKIGENKVIKYKGTNLSNKTITSTADFFISPETVQPYLIKTECFCFIEQTLKSGESEIFTMVFYIDPLLDSDNNFNDLKELVFTYEFSEYKS